MHKATGVVDGLTFQNSIRVTQIDLGPGNYAVIQLLIGTPHPQIFNEYDTVAKRLKSLGISTANLSTNY